MCGVSKSTAVAQASSCHLRPEAASTDLPGPRLLESRITRQPARDSGQSSSNSRKSHRELVDSSERSTCKYYTKLFTRTRLWATAVDVDMGGGH